MASGLQSFGYGAFNDLLAAMQAGPNRGPFVMQADIANSDVATQQTVEQMCSLIKESIADSVTQQVAQGACASWGMGSSDPRAMAAACWWYAKHAIKFRLDSPAVYSMFGARDTLELLISPAVMLRSRKMEGDCDDFSMMLCALVGCCGLGYEIVTVACNPREPQTFSHVFPRAILPDGSRMPLDASHGKYPGWQVPAERISRIQVWDCDGRPVQDAGADTWQGLHGYEFNRGLGACGDCLTYDDSGNCILTDDVGCGGTVINSDPGVTCPAGSVMVAGVCTPTGAQPNQPTCTAINAADCPLGTIFIQGSSFPGVTTASPSVPQTLPGNPFASILASLFGPSSTLPATINAATQTPKPGTLTVSGNTLLYLGIAAFAGLLLIGMAKK